MRKEILLATVVSAGIHFGLLFGFEDWGSEEESTTVITEVELMADIPPPPPPPPPAVAAGESDVETSTEDLFLPEELLAPGLSEPPTAAVSMDALAQFVKPEAPRPPRPDSSIVGIPTGAQRAGAAGAQANVTFSLEQLDRHPAPRYKASPLYPLELQRAGIQGVVHIYLQVDTQGRVFYAEVRSSDNPAFNQPALDAARKWRFEPGVVNGTPVPFQMILPIQFQLK